MPASETHWPLRNAIGVAILVGLVLTTAATLIDDDAVPLPALEARPTLTELRQREQEILQSYTWVDREAGVVCLPIDRAIQLYVERASR